MHVATHSLRTFVNVYGLHGQDTLKPSFCVGFLFSVKNVHDEDV